MKIEKKKEKKRKELTETGYFTMYVSMQLLFGRLFSSTGITLSGEKTDKAYTRNVNKSKN